MENRLDRRELFAAFALSRRPRRPFDRDAGGNALDNRDAILDLAVGLEVVGHVLRAAAGADVPQWRDAAPRLRRGLCRRANILEVHETMLPAGEMPHPPHKHPNTELLFIQTGDLEYLDGDAQTPAKVGPGGVVFSASNIQHGLKNVGTTPATYIVVSVGKQLKE